MPDRETEEDSSRSQVRCSEGISPSGFSCPSSEKERAKVSETERRERKGEQRRRNSKRSERAVPQTGRKQARALLC